MLMLGCGVTQDEAEAEFAKEEEEAKQAEADLAREKREAEQAMEMAEQTEVAAALALSSALRSPPRNPKSTRRPGCFVGAGVC